MNEQIKAYEGKVRSELGKAKSQLAKFEANEKAKDEQVSVDLINQLKMMNQNIEETAPDAENGGGCRHPEGKDRHRRGNCQIKSRFGTTRRKAQPTANESELKIVGPRRRPSESLQECQKVRIIALPPRQNGTVHTVWEARGVQAPINTSLP